MGRAPRWLMRASGVRRGNGRGCWSRGTRFSAGRPCICLKPRSQNGVPAGPRTGRRSKDSGRGDLPGVGLLRTGVLRLMGESGVVTRRGQCPPDRRRPRHPWRRAGVRASVYRGRDRGGVRRSGIGAACVAAVFPVKDLVAFVEELRPEPQSWHSRPRRFRATRRHRAACEPGVGDRRHRALDD